MGKLSWWMLVCKLGMHAGPMAFPLPSPSSRYRYVLYRCGKIDGVKLNPTGITVLMGSRTLPMLDATGPGRSYAGAIL